MATLYTEPRNDKITYHEWAQLIQKTTFEARAFIALGLTNMNTTSAPQIELGSRLEVGGSLYECTVNETISGTPAVGVNYVYCVPGGTSASFKYSTVAPAWNSAKGGWYNGAERAVAKLYYTGSGGGSQYNGKVILDSYNAIRAMNTEQPIPTTGGVVTLTGVVNVETDVTLSPGAYRVEMKGGNGGNGGASIYGDVSHPGGAGAEGQVVTIPFITQSTTEVFISRGGDGNNGNDASDHSAGAGGGCSGGMSYAIIDGLLKRAFGGSGGGGSGGGDDSTDGGGGGGGGGYNVAQDGAGTDVGAGGQGGRNGVGGDGGRSGSEGGTGGGGSGYISGGSAGPPSGEQGTAGGGYGLPGGSGGKVSAEPGNGGISRGETGDLSRYYYNFFQGGGGGGAREEEEYSPGAGGGGLKSTSSGYAIIIRMW